VTSIKPTEQSVSGQLYLDVNENGRYDVGVDRPFAFVLVQLRAPGSSRRLQDRQGSLVISQDITDANGSFTFQNISSEVITAIRQASASPNGTAALTVVAADAPNIPLQVVAISSSSVIVTLETGQEVNISLPPEFFETNPQVTLAQVVCACYTAIFGQISI
jgi:hypothetical protein